MISLGGYTAEKLKYGTTSSGVSSDFQNAMSVAHIMVWRFGMGGSGLLGDYTVIPKEQLSEDIKLTLNRDTQDIFQQCLKEVEKTLGEKREILDRFANELLKREELEYDEIIAIFEEYGYKETAYDENAPVEDRDWDVKT